MGRKPYAVKQEFVQSTPDPSTCIFCNKKETEFNLGGNLISQDGVAVHYFCMLFASGLYQRGDVDNPEDPLKGFLIEDILKEQRRAAKLKCTFCKEQGAPTGCSERRCSTKFHFTCGQKNKVLFQYFDSFSTFCKEHRPTQQLKTKPKKGSRWRFRFWGFGTTQCSICMTPVRTRVSTKILGSPCCRKYFHRDCVQNMATSCGHAHFKCPTCNNVEEFRKEMLTFGIYMPDQDAAWELEPNAFTDHYRQYAHCDAKICLNPKGRDHHIDEPDSNWEIVRCKLCGSQASHFKCNEHKPKFKCEDCVKIKGAKKRSSNLGSETFSKSKGSKYDGSRAKELTRRKPKGKRGRKKSHSVSGLDTSIQSLDTTLEYDGSSPKRRRCDTTTESDAATPTRPIVITDSDEDGSTPKQCTQDSQDSQDSRPTPTQPQESDVSLSESLLKSAPLPEEKKKETTSDVKDATVTEVRPQSRKSWSIMDWLTQKKSPATATNGPMQTLSLVNLGSFENKAFSQQQNGNKRKSSGENVPKRKRKRRSKKSLDDGPTPKRKRKNDMKLNNEGDKLSKSPSGEIPGADANNLIVSKSSDKSFTSVGPTFYGEATVTSDTKIVTVSYKEFEDGNQTPSLHNNASMQTTSETSSINSPKPIESAVVSYTDFLSEIAASTEQREDSVNINKADPESSDEKYKCDSSYSTITYEDFLNEEAVSEQAPLPHQDKENELPSVLVAINQESKESPVQLMGKIKAIERIHDSPFKVRHSLTQ